jgi:hypothetical protein
MHCLGVYADDVLISTKSNVEDNDMIVEILFAVGDCKVGG